MDYSSALKEIIEEAIIQSASDLHISVGHPPALRIAGKLVFLVEYRKFSPEDTKGLAFAMMNEKQKEKFLTEKSVDFSYNFEEKARFRVNVFFQRGYVSIAFRLIPNKILTIEELNLPPILHEFIHPSQGFILITGASSQGKSTTLASLIDEINHTKAVHIITIEDPIEYIFKSERAIIDQRELNRDTLSFAKALKSTFRQDPDVIMVGEMRDQETIATAITAAETGHLVLSTLHTNSAAQSIFRIIDTFPGSQQNQIRAQLSESLLGIVSQRLIPRAKGGLIPACEVLINTPAISNLIRENKIHEIPSIIETSAEVGMISFDRYLVNLVRKKEITLETAKNYFLNPSNFKYLV